MNLADILIEIYAVESAMLRTEKLVSQRGEEACADYIAMTQIYMAQAIDNAKAGEIDSAGKAAFVMHWKSLRRQIRVRGITEREEGPQADAYYASRSLKSRLGAWASQQSQPLASRGALMAEVAAATARHGTNPARPPFWGGIRIRPVEIEFWADGAFRLHDRFQWRRETPQSPWTVQRLQP